MLVVILDRIIFKDFSVGGDCDLFHHGVVKDCLRDISFELCPGQIYGFIGEFGYGGAALSCGLTGNTKFINGQVFVDNAEVSLDYIIENSWYIGYDNRKKTGAFRDFRRNSIREQIEYGIGHYTCDHELSEIKNAFSISDDRFERNIKYVSGERWNASAAIGFSYGKRIFCYPWMNSYDVQLFEIRLAKAVSFLLEFDCIVVFPTTKEDNIRKISPEYNVIFL